MKQILSAIIVRNFLISQNNIWLIQSNYIISKIMRNLLCISQGLRHLSRQMYKLRLSFFAPTFAILLSIYSTVFIWMHFQFIVQLQERQDSHTYRPKASTSFAHDFWKVDNTDWDWPGQRIMQRFVLENFFFYFNALIPIYYSPTENNM